MFLIVVSDLDNSRNVYQCACGCQDTRIVKRSFTQSSWKFAPVIEKEYLICVRCGAEQERGKVPVRLGSQNFPKRNAVWDQWICACGKTPRKAKVTYVNNLCACPKCGREAPKAFPK